MKYILNQGPTLVPETSFLKKLFCKHKEIMSGESCSTNGLVMITASHTLTVCKKCGKLLDEKYTQY